ncbi:hypothetical protein ACWFRC_23310 [Bacillus cereus]
MGDPEKSEYTTSVERTEGTDYQEGKNVPIKEGTESKPEFAKTVERTEGTDYQEGKKCTNKRRKLNNI